MLSTTNQVKPNGNCKPRSARCSKSFHQRLNRNFRCQAAQASSQLLPFFDKPATYSVCRAFLGSAFFLFVFCVHVSYKFKVEFCLQETEDLVTKNVELLRATPLIAGALGVSGVLANRISSGVSCGTYRSFQGHEAYSYLLSDLLRVHAKQNKRLNRRCRCPSTFAPVQIAPVVTASSSQSRTDVLVIVLSAVLLLTGLQWLSLKPKTPVRVEPLGKVIAYMDPDLAADVVEEVQW